jgi:Ca2+-binding EF-hand superfamily protein
MSKFSELKAKFEASSAPAPASERAPSGTSAARAVFEQPAVATSAHQTKSLAKGSSSGSVVVEAKVEEQQAAACPPQFSDDAILAFCTSATLPAINDSNLPPGITESYAELVRNYSECISTIQASMRSMSEIWNQAQKLSRQFPLVQPFSPLNSVPEPGPAGYGIQSSSALARDPALFQKVAEASVSSLKRRNKRFMGEVYNRHALPLGLSARALVSVMHEINPSAFPDTLSDADAAKKLKEIDTSNRGYVIFEELCQATKIQSDQLSRISRARDIFQRLADVRLLSAEALMNALKEVDAPVLLSSEGSSPEQIFRRADANLSGSVDLAEFEPLPFMSHVSACTSHVKPHTLHAARHMSHSTHCTSHVTRTRFRCHVDHSVFRFMRAAELPDDLEMLLEDHRLSVSA